MNRLLPSRIQAFYLFLSALFSLSAHSQQGVLEQYQYDSLGRLTVVEKNNQVIIAYCYDEAGNRIKVNTQGEDCSAAPVALPIPPKPTGLGQGTLYGGGNCYFRWQAPSDAGIDHFQIKLFTIGELLTISGVTRQYSNTRCAEWIRACNAQNECSDQAYY